MQNLFIIKFLIILIILIIILSCELIMPGELVIKNKGIFTYQVIIYDIWDNEKFNTEIKKKSEKSFLLYYGKYRLVFKNYDYKINTIKNVEITPNQILFQVISYKK